MTREEAFYIIGNIPIPTGNEDYDICQYQEAKAIAIDSIEKLHEIGLLYEPQEFGKGLSREERDMEVQKILKKGE